MNDQQATSDADLDPADRPTFAEPWQARAFALAVSMTDESATEDGFGYRWTEFQRELVAEIDARDLTLDDEAIVAPEEPPDDVGDEGRYYRQWLTALEQLLTADGTVDEAALRDRALDFARGDRNAHEFVDGDPHAHTDRLPEDHAVGSDHDHSHGYSHGHGHDHSHGHTKPHDDDQTHAADADENSSDES